MSLESSLGPDYFEFKVKETGLVLSSENIVEMKYLIFKKIHSMIMYIGLLLHYNTGLDLNANMQIILLLSSKHIKRNRS